MKEKIKVIISGPVLIQAGYGAHARLIYRALRSRSDLFDIYIHPTPWGACRYIMGCQEFDEIDELIKKTINYANANGGNPQFDVSVQVKLPTEWKHMAVVNIGVTSGIEATKAIQSWNQCANIMDLILVESEHAKSCFDTMTEIKVVSFPERENEDFEKIELGLETDFNFLCVSQLISRKNVQETILGFLEEFQNDEDVGLVAKISLARDSLLEKDHIEKVLDGLCKKFPDRKCKIYFLFGFLKPEQMSYLYHEEKIKALVSMAKGEGFGLPIFEAACSGMPVISPAFGGPLDYLTMPIKDKNGKTKDEYAFVRVEHIMDNIKPEDYWQGVMEPGQIWAYPSRDSLKRKMRSVYNNYGALKKKAVSLQEYIKENLTKENQYTKIVNLVQDSVKDFMDEED